MALILRHELVYSPNGCDVILHVNPNTTEFARDFDVQDPQESKNFYEVVQHYIGEQFPDLKINMVKIMIGSIVVASVSFGNVLAAETTTPTTTTSQSTFINYTVVSGDTLWGLASKYGTTVTDIKTANNMTTDILSIGQVLKIPQKLAYTTYKVSSGDSLYLIAKRFNTSITAIKSINNLTTDVLSLGQILKIPTTTPTPAPTPTVNTYTVVSGDTLWGISRKFNVTVEDLKRTNSLTTDALYLGQLLKIPAPAATPTEPVPAPAPTPVPTDTTKPTITYITHTVVSGDNPWNISLKYGIPMTELMTVNGFTSSTMLNLGQQVKVPVHNIPVKTTPGPQFGERLDWWTEAQYVVPINKVMKVTDFRTGRSFHIKRTIGANHADSEPLTAEDARIMKEIWGGSYSWAARAIIVEVDGRRLAASMSSMPHDIEYITGNDFNGHFDLYFSNSTRHKDGLPDPLHQLQVDIAAGYAQK